MAFAAIATVAVGGAAYSGVQSSRAAKAQRRSARINERRLQLERSRARKNAIREARLARGRAVNVGANQGIAGSSGLEGSVGSITSQANTNLSFLDQSGRLIDQASAQLGKARKFQHKAAVGASVSQIASAALDLGIGDSETEG